MSELPCLSSQPVLPESIATAVADFGDLGTMAPVAMRVLKMADEEDVSLVDMCRVVSADPGLTARVIRLANTSSYYRGTETTSLERAASLLGLRTLKLVVLCFSLVAEMRDDSIDWSYLWRRSVAGGVLARRVAAHPLVAERVVVELDRADQSELAASEFVETAFVAGLLAEVGRFVLLGVDRARRLVERHGPVPGPALEREHLGVTADTVTAVVLGRWGLSHTIVDAVAARHPTEPIVNPPMMARVLRVADAGAALILGEDAHEYDRPQPTAAVRYTASRVFALDALTSSLVSIGLTVGQMQDLIDDGHRELDDLLDSFELEVSNMLDADDLVTSARHQFTRLSLDSALSQSRRGGDADLVELSSMDRLRSTDSLTGLPNRRATDTFLANYLALQNHASLDLGLLLVEVDRYRQVHETLGPIVGDEVIHALGRRLAERCGVPSLFARLGVERFAVVTTDQAATRLSDMAEKLREATSAEPFASSSAEVDLTISCGGVTIGKASLSSPTDLIMAAEVELERLVAAGGNRVSVRSDLF